MESLVIQRFGLPLALVDLEAGQVRRIEVLSPSFLTAAGARVGTTAAELEVLYGRAQLRRDGQDVCAEFAAAPELSFCLEGPQGKALPAGETWAGAKRLRASVRSIRVLGDPTAP